MTASAARHRREERDFAGIGDLLAMLHVLVVDGDANDLRSLKRVAILRATFPEKDEQIGHGPHFGPAESRSSSALPMRSRTQAK